ncbi:V-type ATP synthase subunit E family protein [Sporosalibacterium faouarense]|uniref:V-type ATP synthase subunit E family protein n=1 Tax=Sporosalibacterium faouarense TaxID=516123 RepID=UPI00141C64CA|nr:V-type ATP synthase subunit E family protein [Sporosalibacterium faouarense]MTI48778.1 hypothetical protein [Bacillota bacterium]
MITIEEKLNTFSKMIFEKEQKEADEKLKNMREENQRIIENHKKEISKKCNLLIEKKVKEAKTKKNEMTSKASLEARNKILNEKKRMLADLVCEIKNRGRRFIENNEYEAFLIYGLSDIFSNMKKDTHLSIYVTEKDVNRFRDKIYKLIEKRDLSSNEIDIIPIEEDIIGGFIIIDHDKDIRIDHTIKTRIEDNKELIGQMLYESLEESGDENE